MKRSMNLWTLVLPLAASFAPLDPAAGQEPQFTFTVPVQAVSMLPELSFVRVICRVFTTATAAGYPSSTGMIGKSAVDVPVSAGLDLVQDVTVTVNVDPGRNPWDVKSYDCLLHLSMQGSVLPPIAGDDQYAFTDEKPGSVLTNVVKGTIP